MSNWMIYGANGFTGRLTAYEAVSRGLEPVLAGRREGAIRPLAERLGLPWRVFPLDDPDLVTRELEAVELVLLLAGPFSQTSKPVVDACLATATHYLDITGEVRVFEDCYARDRAAWEAGCVLLPGVGFDVVASDCLALTLKQTMPSAVRLEIAIGGAGTPTSGTMKTVVEGMGRPGLIRSGGRLEEVPHLWRTKTVAFRDKERFVATMPLPDVSSAYRSTGIPNIACYLGIGKSSARAMKMLRPLMPATRLSWVQRVMKAAIDFGPKGPDAELRASARVQLWGRVEDESGRFLEATLETPEAYTFTASASVTCAERVLADAVEPGAKSPAQAFGSAFVASIPGCEGPDIIAL